MKRRNFIQLSSVAIVGAVSVPALAWKSETKLRILWGGGVRWEDMQKRLTSGSWKNAETEMSDVTGNHFSDFLAKQNVWPGETIWMNGFQMAADQLRQQAVFERAIAENSLERDLESLKMAFTSSGSGTVYLHATDVAHYDRAAYEKAIDILVSFLEENANRSFRMESTLGRNQTNMEFGKELEDTENAHHNPIDSGTRKLFAVEFVHSD